MNERAYVRIGTTGFTERQKIWMGRCAIANGCFDVLHVGHLSLLSHLDDLCFANRIFPIIAINSDSSIRKLKGPGRPLNDEGARAEMLLSLRWPLSVVVFNDSTPQVLMDILRPQFVVKGSDYDPSTVIKWSGSSVSIAPFKNGYSSTRLING